MLNSIFKSFCEYYGFENLYGLLHVTPSTSRSAREVQLENLRTSYTYTNELSEEHLSILKELTQEEANRLSSIENKISQVITQAGLIFALSAFIAPVFGDNLNELNDSLKLLLIILFLLSFVAYLLSILMASRIFAVHNFIYVKTSAASVVDSPPTKGQLVANQVKNIIPQIIHNREVNNRKADLLIFANRLFVLGFGLSGTLSFIVCCMLLFINNPDHKQEKLSLTAKELEYKIQNIDKVINEIELEFKKQKDSLNNKNVTSEYKKIQMEIKLIKRDIKNYKNNLK